MFLSHGRIANKVGSGCVLLTVVVCIGGAGAQSFNVDVGLDSGVPDSSYAAAGLPGWWNRQADYCQALRHLDGTPSTVTMTPAICGQYVSWYDHPETFGDVESLLDDFWQVTDYCQDVEFSGLEPGAYRVIVYAWPAYENAGTIIWIHELIGSIQSAWGPWPGGLEWGVTHTCHIVPVVDGRITIVGCGGVSFSGSLCGFQLVKLECSDIYAETDCGIYELPLECRLDLSDYQSLRGCLEGPGAGMASDSCNPFDYDTNGDVDLRDFARLQVLFGI